MQKNAVCRAVAGNLAFEFLDCRPPRFSQKYFAVYIPYLPILLKYIQKCRKLLSWQLLCSVLIERFSGYKNLQVQVEHGFYNKTAQLLIDSALQQ